MPFLTLVVRLRAGFMQELAMLPRFEPGNVLKSHANLLKEFVRSHLKVLSQGHSLS